MNIWVKWTNFINEGSPIKLFYFGIFVLLLSDGGVRSYASDSLPWIQNLFVNPYQANLADHQFLLTSFLVPAIAYFLGIREEAGFLLLNFLGFVVGNIYLFRLLKSLGKDRFFVYAFIMYSISATLVVWFGKSDMWFFVLSSVLIILRNKPKWAVPIAFLLGLAHLEQAMVVVALMFLMSLIDVLKKQSLRAVIYRYLGVLSGVILAKLFLVMFFTLNDFGSFEGRLGYILDRGFSTFIEPVFKNAIVYIFSLLGLFWLLFFGLAVAFIQTGGKRWVLFAAFLFSLLISSLTLDATRVFSIIFWPMIVYMLLEVPNQKLSEIFSQKLMPMLIAASLLFPIIQVRDSGLTLFAGSSHYSIFK